MPGDTVTAAERTPRPGRYLIPGDTPRRGELIAACTVAVLLAHLLFAQLTLVLAVAFHLITRLTRWRPQWLALPAAAGAVWALGEGLGRAAAGFADGPGKVAAYLGGIPGHPGRIAHLGAAYAGLGHWLPRQFPFALIVAAGEAAVAAWLGWLHTDEWKLPRYQPGLLTYLRRRYLLRFISAGGVVTRDGGCLGLDVATGRRVTLSWAEAEGGVLCTGSPGSGTTTTSFQLVHAAIRRRKPVIAVDLDGSPELSAAFGAVCAATGTPLHCFPGPCHYDPLRGGDPARRTSLVMGMADWSGAAEAVRRGCAAYLTDLFAVIDAAPGDPRVPMLDEIAHLLNPAALRARMERVPVYHPLRRALGERVKVSARLLEADPRTTVALAEQLGELRASPLARWLAPAAGPRVDLGRVVRERGVVLFSARAAAGSRAAALVASLVAHDVLAVCAELRRIGVPGDGLAWFDQCGALAPTALAELVTRGGAAGLAVVLTSASPGPVQALAGQVGVLVLHRLADPAVAEGFAGFTGEKLVPVGGGGLEEASAGQARMRELASLGPFGLVRRPVVPAQALGRLSTGEHVLIVFRPRRRLVTLGLTVPGRAA